jgi:hypothetical protein
MTSTKSHVAEIRSRRAGAGDGQQDRSCELPAAVRAAADALPETAR